MTLLGIPVILACNKEIEKQENNLQYLDTIKQMYLEDIYEYEYKREKALQINIDEKEVTPMENVWVDCEIEIRFKGVPLSKYWYNPSFKEAYIIPTIIFKNETEYNYYITAITAQYFISGGEDGKKLYPMSELFDDKGKYIQSFRGQHFKEKHQYVSDMYIIKPGEEDRFVMPAGYVTILDQESVSDKGDLEVITQKFRKYLGDTYGWERGNVCDKPAAVDIEKGVKMNINVVWESNNPDNKYGLMTYTLVDGKLRVSGKFVG